MKKKGIVDATDGTHEIQYSAGFTRKLLIDGEKFKLRSSNWFINMIDYEITLGNTKCQLVVIGSKADLAVNGYYLGNGEPYEPLSKIPAWVNVFIGLSSFGGIILIGLIGMLIGILFSMLYAFLGIKGKNKTIIFSFVLCTIIQIVVFSIVYIMRIEHGI